MTALARTADKATLSERELTKFARLLGRQPDEAEQVKLCRLKDALGLNENDEVWTFVMALQHYEFLYEQHPNAIEETLRRSLAGLQATAEKAVQVEVARVKGMLEKAVTEAASTVATARAQTSRRLAWWWAGAGLVLFGAFSLVCGFELGRGGLPFWMRREIALDGGAAAKVAGAILGAPAGWMVLALLAPVCGSRLRRSWATATDGDLPKPNRAKAWAAVVAVTSAGLLGAATVIWLVGSIVTMSPSPEPNYRRAVLMAPSGPPSAVLSNYVALDTDG